MRILHLLILILIFNLGLFAQNAEFTQADFSSAETKWSFEIGANRYEIKENGRSNRTNDKNNSAKFQLLLGKGEVVENVYFASYKKDLIIVYGANAGGDGIGYAASFDTATLKQKWRAVINGFNLGQGLIENQFAYLTAIGFVSKLNLLTGKYVWKHDNLYSWKGHNGVFNSFELPELDGNIIIFSEKTNNNSTNTIVVNKITGKIIRTIL